MNKFIHELQSLEEPVKTRVLVIATILVMAIVIYFWIGYFSSIVTSVPAVPVADQQPTPTGQSPAGFFQNVANGMAAVTHTFGNFFRAPKTYEIKPN